MNATDLGKDFQPYSAKRLQTSANYAQQCYSANTSGLLGCGTFVQSKLASEIDKNATCPFSESICRSSSNNLVIDTGYLDSHVHFGLNATPNERFQYRRVIQCAPIITEGYTTKYNLSDDRSYTRYWYGTPVLAAAERNFTDQYSNDELWELKQVLLSEANPDYGLGLTMAWSYNGTVDPYSGFDPVPELRRPNAEVNIFFLSPNKIIFKDMVNDPWFRATVPSGKLYNGPESENIWSLVYAGNEPASPLACSQ
ncbi:unnamed protein product [Discula destructiva]